MVDQSRDVESLEFRYTQMERNMRKVSVQLDAVGDEVARSMKDTAALRSEMGLLKNESKGSNDMAASYLVEIKEENFKLKAKVESYERALGEIKDEQDRHVQLMREMNVRIEGARQQESVKSELDKIWSQLSSLVKANSERAAPAAFDEVSSFAGAQRYAGGTPAASIYGDSQTHKPHDPRERHHDLGEPEIRQPKCFACMRTIMGEHYQCSSCDKRTCRYDTHRQWTPGRGLGWNQSPKA